MQNAEGPKDTENQGGSDHEEPQLPAEKEKKPKKVAKNKSAGKATTSKDNKETGFDTSQDQGGGPSVLQEPSVPAGTAAKRARGQRTQLQDASYEAPREDPDEEDADDAENAPPKKKTQHTRRK